MLTVASGYGIDILKSFDRLIIALLTLLNFQLRFSIFCSFSPPPSGLSHPGSMSSIRGYGCVWNGPNSVFLQSHIRFTKLP